jgi:uncharacterized protein (TIGR03000 family)
MLKNIKLAVAAAVLMAAASPAFAVGGYNGYRGYSHGGGYRGYSQHYHGYYHNDFYHNGHHHRGYYHNGFYRSSYYRNGFYQRGYYQQRGYRFYGAWPYFRFSRDPGYAAAFGEAGPALATAAYESEEAAFPASVRVRTAPDARLWFGGSATRQTGSLRTLTTPPLQPGKSYTYPMRAVWMENGKAVARSRTVSVAPGETAEVDLRNHR